MGRAPELGSGRSVWYHELRDRRRERKCHTAPNKDSVYHMPVCHVTMDSIMCTNIPVCGTHTHTLYTTYAYYELDNSQNYLQLMYMYF